MATGTTPFTRGVDGSNSFTYSLTLPKLRDPNYESDTKGAQAVADTFGDRPIVIKAGTQREIDPAFVALVRRKIRQH